MNGKVRSDLDFFKNAPVPSGHPDKGCPVDDGKMRLNVGCGERRLTNAINLDGPWNPKADYRFDLETCGTYLLPFTNDQFDEIIMSHVIEHIKNLLPLMQELWRVAKPFAKLNITCPHGASDDADEDPTHYRRMYPNSFLFFSQPAYHKADYGYRGDWQPVQTTMLVSPQLFEAVGEQELIRRALYERNSVIEIWATLTAVKPIRERTAPMQMPQLRISPQPEGWVLT